MKKILTLLTITFIALFLTACNIQTVEEFEKMEQQERSVDDSPTDEKVEQTKIDTDSDHAKDEQKQKEKVTEETALKEDIEKKTKQPEVTKDETPKKANEKPQQETKQPVVNEKPKSEATEQPKQPQKKQSVTIAIRVDTLLKNWDLLDPSLQSEKYVPKNGVILKTTTYDLLSEKDTVWDILQRATKEHKIQIEYQGANENIYNSVYIEGINHIYEFSAGELSGWMYKVNGVYPNYGSSQYVLKNGDVIEWHYTVDLGRDLGQEWAGE